MFKISAENTEENTHTYLGKQELNKVENKVVVLDAGHGGTDVGTSVDYIEEKSINMQITNKLKESLEDKGVEVILTRKNDETMALSERTEIANSYDADLFLSIHCNFYEKDNSVSGFEAYYFNNKIAKSYADFILNKLSSEEYIKTRNVKSEDYYVLKNAKVPAVLLSRENKNSNWQTRRIRELEEEVAKLKNRTLWQQIWEDIKPKRKGNCYGRRNKWKEFGKKVLDVVLAVGYAVAVCWGVWWVMQ